MKILCVASEGVPFSKTGGLADVVGALPAALHDAGHLCWLFLPCHRSSWEAGLELVDTGLAFEVAVGGSRVGARVRRSVLPGSEVPVYLIDQPAYFDRDGLYLAGGQDYPDNCERFVFFNRAVLEAARRLNLRPDVIHCNDWQTGLIPVYLRMGEQAPLHPHGCGTLFTIHNLAYRGLFGSGEFPLTGLDWRYFNHHALEFHGWLSFIKGGLVFADLLNTVSPTYAREIQTQELGCGLNDLLRTRAADLRGIVNGIDPQVWGPSHDARLARTYDLSTVREGKAYCKAWLQKRAGLPLRPEIPLFAQIGRLDAQKGWDLLAESAPCLLEQDVQLIVLGTGNSRYHELLTRLASRHAGKLWAHLGFSDALAHQIEAAADVFLMPSLFEPCGLNQLYSLAYGTVPLVRATGGLTDTVVDLTDETLADGTATGFVFAEATGAALWRTMKRALDVWRDPDVWGQLVRNGMREDWSWSRSVRDYVKLYEEILGRVRPWGSQSVMNERLVRV